MRSMTVQGPCSLKLAWIHTHVRVPVVSLLCVLMTSLQGPCFGAAANKAHALQAHGGWATRRQYNERTNHHRACTEPHRGTPVGRTQWPHTAAERTQWTQAADCGYECDYGRTGAYESLAGRGRAIQYTHVHTSKALNRTHTHARARARVQRTDWSQQRRCFPTGSDA